MSVTLEKLIEPSRLFRKLSTVCMVLGGSTILNMIEYIFFAFIFRDPAFLVVLQTQNAPYIALILLNIVQRTPVLIIWIIQLVVIIRLWKELGVRPLKPLILFVAFIVGLILISIVYYCLVVLSVVEPFFRSTLATLDPDFVLVGFMNVFELVLWKKFQTIIIKSPDLHIKQKQKLVRAISALNFAVVMSLLLKIVFLLDEVQVFWLFLHQNYFLYYFVVFSISAFIELIGAVFFLISGSIIKISLRIRESAQNKFNFTQK